MHDENKDTTAEHWNRYHSRGDEVYCWPDGRRDKQPIVTRLRTRAWNSELGPVVAVHGVDGALPLDCVQDLDSP